MGAFTIEQEDERADKWVDAHATRLSDSESLTEPPPHNHAETASHCAIFERQSIVKDSHIYLKTYESRLPMSIFFHFVDSLQFGLKALG